MSTVTTTKVVTIYHIKHKHTENHTSKQNIKLDVLTAVAMNNNTIFRDVTPYRRIEVERRFEGMYYLQRQGSKQTCKHQTELFCLYVYLLGITFDPEGSSTSLRNVGKLLPDCTALLQSNCILQVKTQLSHYKTLRHFNVSCTQKCL